MTKQQWAAVKRLVDNNGSVAALGEAPDHGDGWIWVTTPDRREVPVHDDGLRSWLITPTGRVHA